jgi:hypothetical protein
MMSKEDQKEIKNRNICYELQGKYNIPMEDFRTFIMAAIKGWEKTLSNKK